MEEDSGPSARGLLDGRYEATARLHISPMSRIYAAKDLRDGGDVVIKVVTADKPDSWWDPEETVPRLVHERLRESVLNDLCAFCLRREAVALATLRHPRIVRALGSGLLADGRYYLVLEALRGTALDRLPMLTKVKWVTAPIATQIALELLEALGAVHEAGLVHRDVKPGNVMLTPQGVKLIDFGLAALSDGSDIYKPSPTTAVGTPLYMAPEQCMGIQADARADLYACGHLLYRLLTGNHALLGADRKGAMEVLRMQIESRPTPFRLLAARYLDIPPLLEAVVMRALEKDPNDRFRTAQEMRLAIIAATSTT